MVSIINKNTIFLILVMRHSPRTEMPTESMNFGDLATWVSAVVALISAALAIRSSRDADRHQKQAAQALAKQNMLQEREWAEQYFADVRKWADEVCLTISESIHIARYPELATDLRTRLWLEARLSKALDTGRWYFPNIKTDVAGKTKEPAYRGYRQPILDHVFNAYIATVDLRNIESQKDSVATLVRCQRCFVSEVQEVLDPRRRQIEVARVLKEFELSESIRGDTKSDA